MNDIYQQAAMGEYQRVLADYATEKKSKTALQNSYGRHDQLIAKSTEASSIKPACRAGCAFCCHYKVEVRAHEVFLIKEHMEQRLSPELQQSILAEAETNAQTIKNLTPEEHLSTNIKCPFLIDSQCSIYTVRPFRCRNFHATDVSICEASFNAPADMSIANNLIESVALFGDAHTQGYEAAAHKKGLDPRVYDFTSALLEAFGEANALKRYNRGKKAFLTAIEVDQGE
jgi:Fe-S-cluster containining protein